MSTAEVVTSYRRYCLGKRRAACALDELALEQVWHGKQIAEPGTDLPSDFPYRAELIAAWYLTYEDLTGADAVELADHGFTSEQAAEILAALP
jgi:hypothetical protein